MLRKVRGDTRRSITQVRDNRSFQQGGRYGLSEKCSDSGHNRRCNWQGRYAVKGRKKMRDLSWF